MTALGIDGFDYTTIELEGSAYRVGVAGEGPALLLLHGFPQYHYCWHRLAALNIVPTIDQFERMAEEASLDYYPWYFLAQPPPFAERIVDASAEYLVRHTIGCPVLVHWGPEEGAMSDGPLDVWRGWADDVQGGPLRSGHFIPEEAAGDLATSLTRFLS